MFDLFPPTKFTARWWLAFTTSVLVMAIVRWWFDVSLPSLAWLLLDTAIAANVYQRYWHMADLAELFRRKK